MPKLILKDLDYWKSLNPPKNGEREFSCYDYLYSNLSEINSDIYFAFLELCWPTFIQHEGYIFLKENFSVNYFSQLKTDNSKLELWMNFLTLDSYFENDEDGNFRAKIFAEKLVTMWKAKLKIEFPTMQFVAKSLVDDEFGDVGLTFYQEKFEETK